MLAKAEADKAAGVDYDDYDEAQFAAAMPAYSPSDDEYDDNDGSSYSSFGSDQDQEADWDPRGPGSALPASHRVRANASAAAAEDDGGSFSDFSSSYEGYQF